ncbi:MAG TPA: hypothetical protein VIK78_19605 [Ruminiclostridium sp.]
MLNVTGTCQVYRVENKGNFVIASLRTSKKNKKTDEWESEFFNAKFVGSCKEQAANLIDKDKITITSSLLENRKYLEKSYLSVVVFEFKSEEKADSFEGITPPQTTTQDGFYPTDEDDELPF